MRNAAALGAAALLAAVACGGSERYAGLTREEADARLASLLQRAESTGTVAEQVGEAMAGSPEEAMGRAGASTLGSRGPKVVREGATIRKGAAPESGEAAWVGSYDLTGLGSALSLCVYVWDAGSRLDVRARC
jgi:hypothetical protein